MTIYLSDLDRVDLHPSGWIHWQDLEITAAPLIDTSHLQLFARLTYDGAIEIARRWGARLLTQREHDEVWDHGYRLQPVIMPPGPEMASLDYALRHDARVLAQLDGWDGSSPLANAGKQWVAGAPPGRSWNYGWWDPRAPNGIMWQRLGAAHDRRHSDYSQLSMLVRPRQRPATEPPDTDREHDTLPGVDASAAVLSAARATVEGGLSAVAAVSYPHGYRCSVRELVEDARALGTWRPRGDGYIPQRGDLVISARAGGDPTRGGQGHVERVVHVSYTEPIWIETIGGNEGNEWTRAPYTIGPDLRGYVEVPTAIGHRAVDVALEELAAGVREIPGAQHHPRVQLYHAGARRGGSAVAGMPGHEHDGTSTLGAAAADEVAWCASGASWCSYQAARPVR